MKGKYGEFQSMIVLQYQQQFIFDIYADSIEWNIERIIWIAFHKNVNNKHCLFAKLPKDLVRKIIRLIGTGMIDESRSFIKI